MKTQPIQVVVIHGGDTFDSYEEYLVYLKSFEIDISYFSKKGWKDTLAVRLGEEFELIAPRMPNAINAKYSEWKIWFDKFLPFLRDGVVLIGHSLGGIFLVKYLSENTFPIKIAGTILLAAPFDAKDADYSMGDFILPDSLSRIEQQSQVVHIWQSEDDKVVPFADLAKYQKALPKARVRIFENCGHFIQEEFPELIEEILKTK